MVMKKWVGLSAALAAVLAGAWLSVARVPAGSFGIAGGRVLAPGWRAKAPWHKVRVYRERETAAVRLSMLTREGARKEGEVRVEYAWDRERLAKAPVPRERVRETLGSLKEYPGAGLRAALEERLASLPVRLLSLSTDIEGELPEAVKAAYRPTGRKVVFCGLDALDWILVDRLIGEGRMPTFARLKREGAWANLTSFKPLLSPLLWNTIGTSRPPDQHGILDFIITDPATGQKAPITSDYRKVQAFWNILSAFKLRTDVVGWWASYPAEKINGTMITERLFFSLFGIEPPRMAPGNTYPPDAEARFAPLMVPAEKVPLEEVGRYVHLDRAELERRWAEGVQSGNLYSDPVNHLRRILAVTRSVFNITETLMREPFDALAFYVEGPDTVAHRFAQCLPPRLPWIPEAEYQAGRDALPRYYESIDADLGRLMRLGPPDAVWIIASDHGFFTGEARPSARPDDFGTGAPEWHRLTGVLAISGPGVRPGELKDVNIYDLIPTMFHVLGVPVSREMKGRAVTEAFTGLAAVPPVDTYEFLPPPLRDRSPVALDEERMKELQALGYIGGNAPAPSSTPAPTPEAGPREDFSQAYNKANTLYQQGDFDGAMEQYRRSIELRPDFALGMYSLAQCYALQGDHRQAVDWIKRTLQLPQGQGLPSKILVQLVDESKAAGEAGGVLEALESVRSDWEQDPTYFVALGRAYGLRGDETEAIRWFEHARVMDPGHPLATEELLNRYLARQDRDGLARLIKSAWDASAGSIQTMNYLGLVCLRAGQGRIAEEIFRKVLASDPENGGILANLAIALQLQGRGREARAAFDRAVKAQPDNAQLRFNFGACLAETGAFQEALTLFLQARDLGLRGVKVHTALASVYYRLGRKAEARTAVEAVLALEPANPEAHRILDALNR